MNRKYLSFLTAVLALTIVIASALPISTTPVQAQDADCTNGVWFGTSGYGAGCLTSEGIVSFKQGESKIGSDFISDIEVCEDGKTYIVYSGGIDIIEGGEWSSAESEFFTANAAACDGKGGLWVAHFEGLSHFDGSNWTTIASDKLGTGDNVSLVDDVAVDAEGTAWVVTANSVAAVKSADEIEFWEEGQGFDDQLFFDRVAIDSEGKVYAIHSSGVATYDGSEWTNGDQSFIVVQSALIDSDNNLWVGTYADGIIQTEGAKATTITQEEGLSSNRVYALAQDGKGRLWAATEYGLSVMDGDSWTKYLMSNSDLPDNSLRAVEVSGDGPESLPEAVEKEPGSITGKVVDGGEPVADNPVELCTMGIGFSFTGKTPCENDPDSQLVTTDAEGNFTFENVPVGRYSLITQGKEDKWVYPSGEFGGELKVEVTAGEEAELANPIDINVKEE